MIPKVKKIKEMIDKINYMDKPNCLKLKTSVYQKIP